MFYHDAVLVVFVKADVQRYPPCRAGVPNAVSEGDAL